MDKKALIKTCLWLVRFLRNQVQLNGTATLLFALIFLRDELQQPAGYDKKTFWMDISSN